MDATLPLAKPDFSLVLGGPIYQLFRRAHLSGPAWSSSGGGLGHHARGLNLALLVVGGLTACVCVCADLFCILALLPRISRAQGQVGLVRCREPSAAGAAGGHLRTRSVVAGFLDRRLVRSNDVPRFEALIASAMRLRNSVVIELGLLVLVATVGGQWLWRSTIAFGSASWYAVQEEVDGAARSWYVVRLGEPPGDAVPPPFAGTSASSSGSGSSSRSRGWTSTWSRPTPTGPQGSPSSAAERMPSDPCCSRRERCWRELLPPGCSTAASR